MPNRPLFQTINIVALTNDLQRAQLHHDCQRITNARRGWRNVALDRQSIDGTIALYDRAIEIGLAALGKTAADYPKPSRAKKGAEGA
jgi:hypothetical protein